jgi:purine-binding chemotaxis protein CheW
METIQDRSISSADSLTASREGKYLTFSLDNQEYGIGILKVREIIGMMPITAIPQAPHYVRGVINLRGKVIPIVDFRLKFGMAEAEQTNQTCMIVVGIEGPAGTILIGAVIDSVTEVLDIKEADIENAPVLDSNSNADFILGMAKMGKGVKILLDIDRVLNARQLQNVAVPA